MARPTRFSRLYAENWRNFRRVDVRLPRRAFIVGANASGKSNFLDVFRFLHDLVSVGGGLSEAVRRRGGVSALRCLAARRYPDISLHVELVSVEHDPEWAYDLAFTQDNRQRPKVTAERVAHRGRALVERPNEEDTSDPERLTQTYLEQVNVNRPFREIADFFASVRYLHIVPQLVREPDRSVGRVGDPYGGDFLEQIARTPQKTQTSRLRRISAALRVAVPQLKELELSRDVRGTPHLRGRYAHWRPHAGWQSETQFSDGTLRLLGLLWAILDGAGPLLLEEPELSLHPEVVRRVPQLLHRAQSQSGRQVLLSTHSSDLLLDPGIDEDEVLLLIPTPDGTAVRLASTIKAIKELRAGGLALSDIVIPETRPEDAEQLGLFDGHLEALV